MFTQVMGTVSVKHLARGAAAGIKRLRGCGRSWVAGHIPAVMLCRDPEGSGFVGQHREGFWCWQCRMQRARSPRAVLWEERTCGQMWRMQAWTDGIIYRVN